MDIKRVVAKGLRKALQPPAITASTLDKTARVCSGTQVNQSTVGRYSYIGHDGFVLKAQIGPFCSIADNCGSAVRHTPLRTCPRPRFFMPDIM